MVTNDPQAGYEPAEEGRVTHEYELTMKVIDLGAEQREPLLSDADIIEMRNKYVSLVNGGLTDLSSVGVEMEHDELRIAIDFGNGAGQMRSRYENLITSGELMVSKTTSLTDTDVDDITWWACTECNTNVGEGIYQPKWKFCPGCGARIIE